MTEHTYGWIKDPFNVNAVYHQPVVRVLPPSTNNRIYFPKVQDQDGVGCCGGFSWAEHINAVCKQIGQPVDRFSENWVYNGARYIQGTLNQDSGLTNDNAILWMYRNGFLTYPNWPFADKLDTTDPNTKKSLAVTYPNIASYRVDNGVDGLKSAMADGHTMVVGCPWFAEWENYTGGVLPVPTTSSQIVGGHDTLWGDYDDSLQAFYCQNSWSDTWGIKGRFWVPYAAIDVIKQMGGYDAHYLTFSPLPVPPPDPPTPTTGTIVVSSIPPAVIISVDNIIKGAAPQTITLPAGDHVISGNLPGYTFGSYTIPIAAGSNYTFTITLSKPVHKCCISQKLAARRKIKSGAK